MALQRCQSRSQKACFGCKRGAYGAGPLAAQHRVEQYTARMEHGCHRAVAELKHAASVFNTRHVSARSSDSNLGAKKRMRSTHQAAGAAE